MMLRLGIIAALFAQGAYALSDACREEFARIQTHPEYAKATVKFYKYCRLRIENKLTACCNSIDFVNEQATECRPTCETQCQFHEYWETCQTHLGGQACVVERKPFKDNIPSFTLKEYFCLPQECLNDADKDSIMEHYAYSWQEGREGWRKDYGDSSIQCEEGSYWSYLFMIALISCCALVGMCVTYVAYVPPSLRKQQGISPEDQKYRAVEVLKKMNDIGDQ